MIAFYFNYELKINYSNAKFNPFLYYYDVIWHLLEQWQLGSYDLSQPSVQGTEAILS